MKNCEHCREVRKTKAVKVKCMCSAAAKKEQKEKEQGSGLEEEGEAGPLSTFPYCCRESLRLLDVAHWLINNPPPFPSFLFPGGPKKKRREIKLGAPAFPNGLKDVHERTAAADVLSLLSSDGSGAVPGKSTGTSLPRLISACSAIMEADRFACWSCSQRSAQPLRLSDGRQVHVLRRSSEALAQLPTSPRSGSSSLGRELDPNHLGLRRVRTSNQISVRFFVRWTVAPNVPVGPSFLVLQPLPLAFHPCLGIQDQHPILGHSHPLEQHHAGERPSSGPQGPREQLHEGQARPGPERTRQLLPLDGRNRLGRRRRAESDGHL